MLTFRQYIIESVTGNYVSIDVASDLPSFGLDKKYKDSTICTRHDQHVTLIYSKDTNIPLGKIQKFLKIQPSKITAQVVDVAAFDSIPKDGERDGSKCTIVLKVKSDELVKIHEGLKEIGLKHSYEDFSPHISLIYDFPQSQKDECIKYIKDQLGSNIQVSLKDFKNEKIKEDWAKTLKD